MGKVSKNARVGKGKISGGGKDMVKVIVAEKNEKGSYVFKEKIVHKDKVKETLSGK